MDIIPLLFSVFKTLVLFSFTELIVLLSSAFKTLVLFSFTEIIVLLSSALKTSLLFSFTEITSVLFSIIEISLFCSTEIHKLNYVLALTAPIPINKIKVPINIFNIVLSNIIPHLIYF